MNREEGAGRGECQTRCNNFHLSLFFKGLVSMLWIAALSTEVSYTQRHNVVSA